MVDSASESADRALSSLVAGDPYASLHACAKAVAECETPELLERWLEGIERTPGSGERPGWDWARRLLVLGSAARFPAGGSPERLLALTRPGWSDLRLPLVMVAGDTGPGCEEAIGAYRPVLSEALADFEGTLISGGTRAGVSGLVGDLGAEAGGRLRTVGYLPEDCGPESPPDLDSTRYHELRRTRADRFSPLEPLQAWTDVLASGVPAADVRVLGIGGGRIAACEYRVALALGARVGVVRGSGRAADAILEDPDWAASPHLTGLPDHEPGLRRFLGSPPPPTPE